MTIKQAGMTLAGMTLAGVTLAGSLLAGTVGWRAMRPGPMSSPRRHVRDTVQAAERLHSATLGVFQPPKPGEDLNLPMLEMEAAGDRIYTLAAMWLQDRVRAYEQAPPADKGAAAAQVHDAIAQLRRDLVLTETTDPVISQARQDVSNGLDLLEKDVP